MIVVAIIGVLASVAIPAFMKYVRRAHTIEATQNIRKMYDSAVAYYVADHASMNQLLIARQFPDTVGATPAVNPCCGQPGDKCSAPNAAPTFKQPTWEALNFSMDDPFYYWYSFDSSGTDLDASFSAWAFGNLDCDANFSTYMRGAHVDAAHNIVSGGGGIYMRNELE